MHFISAVPKAPKKPRRQMSIEFRDGFWRTKGYTQRMTSKEWKDILLEEKDTIIIAGELRQIVAKSLGSGVVEISLKPKVKS